LFIVSDRGLYSFLTYQLLRIKHQYQIHNLNYLEKWIKDIFQPLGRPDVVILLISSISDIKKRIKDRDGVIKKNELSFIQEVQKEYLKIFKETSCPSYLILENRNGNFEYVEREAIKRIKEIINNI
jgi:thymidylate kinase